MIRKLLGWLDFSRKIDQVEISSIENDSSSSMLKKEGEFEEDVQKREFELLVKAAIASDSDAQYKVAMMFLGGYGTDQDDDAFERWASSAAYENNHAGALLELAYYHFNYDCRNLWYELDPETQHLTYLEQEELSSMGKANEIIRIYKIKGKLLYNEQAYDEFEMLAKAGLLEAQEHLAMMYQIGSGFRMEPDLIKAMHWYNEADKNGSEIARRKLEHMKSEI